MSLLVLLQVLATTLNQSTNTVWQDMIFSCLNNTTIFYTFDLRQ